ncbi:MAG: peptidase MA family metallohydrolase [Chloroflexota bacterium]
MRWFLTFIALLAVVGPTPTRGTAQGQIEILSSTAENRFPSGIAFRIDALSTTTLETLSLTYKIGEEQSTTVPVSFEPGRHIEAEYVLGDKEQGTYLHADAEIGYHWSIADANGEELHTSAATVTYKDTRFDWQETASHGITLFWYKSSQAFADERLQIGVADLQRSSRLLGIAEDLTVKVLVYSSMADMVEALPWKNRTPEPRLPTLGLQVSPKTVLLLGNHPNVARTLAHELSHIAVRQGVGYIPSWLDEGLALLAEDGLAPEHAAALERAIKGDKVLHLRDMTEVPDPREHHEVWLYYGQAYSVARFMIASHGEDDLRTLMALLKRGEAFDDALLQVYSRDTDGLESEWRESTGLPRSRLDELTAVPGTSRKPTSTLAQQFTAYAILAGFSLGCLFLFPFTTLWLVVAAAFIYRQKHRPLA